MTPLDSIEVELERMTAMSIDELRAAWHLLLGEPAPDQSKELLRYRLAWAVQATAFGGIASATQRRLRSLHEAFDTNPRYSPSPTLDLKPGSVLLREWRGTRHRVRVLDDGFEYMGERFGSLSEVARKIAGTRWNGPRFFGLRDGGTDK